MSRKKKKKLEEQQVQIETVKDDPIPNEEEDENVKCDAPQKAPVSPFITINDPKVVLVKKKHQTDAHRISVHLSATPEFTGTGKLSCNNDTLIAIYKDEKGGNKLQMQDIPGEKLTSGLTLYIEGCVASTTVEDITLTLTLTKGGEPLKTKTATETITCVELTLEIYKSRPQGGGDPVVLTVDEKIEPGRAILVQNSKIFAERAMVKVCKAVPDDYKGSLVLKGINGKVELFAQGEEKPATGQVAQTDLQRVFANDAIDKANGQILWVQGKSKSDALKDTGLKIELKDLPDIEGDLAKMSVLKAEIRLLKSRSKPAAEGEPSVFSDDDKVDGGRYVHQQTGNHHGRAGVIVRKLEPAGFEGKIFLSCWDLKHTPSYTEAKSGAPKIQIFTDEVPANGQVEVAFDSEIEHNNDFPAKGKVFWIQGKTVSGQLRDSQIRLGIKDVDKGGDRTNFTVVRFKKLKADIPSTPANINRDGNSPVPRHELIIANGGLAEKDFNEDFATNLPVVLVEGSIKNSDKIKLDVKIEPAGVPVSWSVQRDKRTTAPKGDHATIIALAGNSEDPGLTQDLVDKLKATLTANAVGSFHIRPYVDCNGNGKFDYNNDAGTRIDREPFILVNVVLIRVKGFNNLSVANSAAGSATIVKSGGMPTGVNTGDFAGTGNDAVHMKATARVIGGGQDGKRGLDRLFTGWVNNELNCSTSPGPNNWGEDATHSFQKSPPPVSPPIKRTRCYWALAGVEITGPVIDSGGYGGAGLSEAARGKGGNTATGTAGSNDCTVNKTNDVSGIGQRWQVENVDSPGGPILLTHPTDAASTLRNFKFNIDFRCDLVFWTNRDRVKGISDVPASRLYSSVQSNTWNIRVESDFDATYAETVVTAKTVTFTKDNDATRLATPVDGSGLETRCPGGLYCGKYDQPF